jgi:RNA polymerase sigma factor (sigma-70 family)
MLPRQNTVEIFSTFIQFDYDRFSSWATDARLRRSMRQSLQQMDTTVNSDNFWALYWHQIWHEQPKSIAREHLAAYLQEVCFWSAQKTISGFSSTQYTVPDCFQVAIAGIDKVLKGFDRERGFNLKSYASITFGNLIRELLRQKREIDICSDWSLLRKLSQKRMTEALADAGLEAEVVDKYILAWNCLKTIYVPERASSTRKLPKPEPETWIAIANLYNQERSTQLKQSGSKARPEDLEKWLLNCVKAARAYLFPSVTSINQTRPGYDTGEIVDSLVGDIDDSLLTEIIVEEEAQQRSQQHTDINQFLTQTIKKLKPEEQKLLELYYSLGLKQAEIAQELNTQQYTISRKLSKARKLLLKALAQWTQEKMHISLTSDVLENISSLLEEWLAGYYDSSQ